MSAQPTASRNLKKLVGTLIGVAIPLVGSIGCNGTSLGDALSSLGAAANKPSAIVSEPLTISGPADLTVECDGAGNTAALNAWLADVSFTQGCGSATLTNNFTTLSDGCGATGSAHVTWTVTDGCNQTATHTATFTIADTTAPTLAAPSPITVTCGDAGASTALLNWRASAAATDLCGGVTITSKRTASPGNCTATITWTATDTCGNATSASASYTVSGDSTPPTMTLNGATEMTIECGQDTFVDPGVTLSDDCDALITAAVTGAVDTHQPGNYTMTYNGVDACGNAAPPLTRLVHVVDTRPPTLQPTPPMELWPPNHQMVTLTLEDIADVVDACEGKLDLNVSGRILSIYSDEPDNTNGDGNTTSDILIINPYTFSLRAERAGGGNGRVYGIQFEVTDASGNSADLTATVVVPHDQSGQTAIDDGANAGQRITPP